MYGVGRHDQRYQEGEQRVAGSHFRIARELGFELTAARMIMTSLRPAVDGFCGALELREAFAHPSPPSFVTNKT